VFIIKLLLKDTKSDCRTFLYGYNVLLHDFLNRIPYHIVDLPQNGYNLLIFLSLSLLQDSPIHDIIAGSPYIILQSYIHDFSLYSCNIKFKISLNGLIFYLGDPWTNTISYFIISLHEYYIVLQNFPIWIAS
jgi:hypothetical protein